MRRDPKEPSIYELIAESLGEEGALAVTERLGGTRWHVPKGPLPESHPWVEALGAEWAEQLRKAFEGESSLSLPRDQGALDILICRDIAAGMKQNAVARKYRVNTRLVQRAIRRQRELEALGGQGDLFAGA